MYMGKLTMNVRHTQSFWVGIFVVLGLLNSVALAEPAASAVQATSVTPPDAEKLVAQAEKALDRDEIDVAVKLYTQAAELNYTPAQVARGELAESAQFYEEAVGWFLMAASQGDAAGQFHLGRMYLAGTGIKKDDAKALYWVRRSAGKNYLLAVQAIATAYKFGGFSELIKADPVQEKLWHEKFVRLEAIAKKITDEKLAELAASQKKLQEEAEKKANKNK